MLAEHERRFARIVSDYIERLGGDYAELLRRYASSPDGVDPDAWRAQIRAQARRDKIRVTSRDGERAIAVRNRAVGDQELRAELDRANVLRQLTAAARALGHEPGHWLRADQESVCLCRRYARLYVHTAGKPISDGEALSEPCPAPSCAPSAEPTTRWFSPPAWADPRDLSARLSEIGADAGLRQLGQSCRGATNGCRLLESN